MSASSQSRKDKNVAYNVDETARSKSHSLENNNLRSTNSQGPDTKYKDRHSRHAFFDFHMSFKSFLIAQLNGE